MNVLFVSNSAAGEATGRLGWTARLAELGARVRFALPECDRAGFAAFERRGVDVVGWPLERRRRTPASAFAAWRGLTAVLRRTQPDLVHAFGHEANVYASLAARAAGRPALALHITGLGSAFLPQPGRTARALRTFYHLNPGRARLLAFQNHEDRAELGFTASPRAALIEGTGVDLAGFDPAAVPPAARARLRGAWGAGPETVVVVSIGRLIRDKGVDELLAAWRSVMAGPEAPDARLILVGDGDPGNRGAIDDIERRVGGGASSRSIRLLGRREDIREILASADLFLNASHREGLPRTNLEALAMGVPVLTTDAVGCRDTVEHGESGWRVPPRDAGALAGALELLMRDAGLRARLGAAGRRRAGRLFAVESIVDQVWRSYGQAFGATAGAAFEREAAP